MTKRKSHKAASSPPTAYSLPAVPSKVRGLTRGSDITLGWLAREYPQLIKWRALAVDWIKGETRALTEKLMALSIFFERYMVNHRLPVDPPQFLSRTAIVPDFFSTCCPQSIKGVKANNDIHAFIDFVLKTRHSVADDYGRPVIVPTLHNPIVKRRTSGFPRHSESVRSTLPIGYIDELRRMLAQGPHFRDWTWAQNAMGAEVGASGRVAPDWFTVAMDQIDQSDPDCVWRVRQRVIGPILEMWSPVSWSALLIKLILPLRTGQIRTLDSGEADTWRFDLSPDGASGVWSLNTRHLAQGSTRRPLQVGIFRRRIDTSADILTELYINTNKTADQKKSGDAKGYTMPWQMGGPIHANAYYWLVKLRNWQIKYNPVEKRTPWSALDARHIEAKSNVQLAGYPDSCFLFRTAEVHQGEHLPLNDSRLEYCWFYLLEQLERNLATRAETHSDGSPISLVIPVENSIHGKTRSTHYPLHSLRVSLITALAIDGQMPIHILQKLVGHSRLIMTLYYTKPGASHIRQSLADATRRLEERKDASIVYFLRDASHERLVQQAIANSTKSLIATIPEHPGNRNPAGWQLLHHGLCLVGGNTSTIEGNKSIGGCHNGGPMASSKFGAHDPVPGGIRNCVRCRWFVTEPHFLPALVAHWNTLSYQLWDALDACSRHDAERQALFTEQAVAGNSGLPFSRMAELRQAERLYETAMKRASDRVEDIAATWRLIDRCKQALNEPKNANQALIAAGTAADVQLAFDQTDSELRQISGVCQDVEVYPDLIAGDAVIRRSQLLDAALQVDRLKPIFLTMSKQDQLLAGNAFMRRLAQQTDATDPVHGMRKVIDLIDAGESLRQHLGLDLTAALQAGKPLPVKLKLIERAP
jgi:hypothetical protein